VLSSRGVAGFFPSCVWRGAPPLPIQTIITCIVGWFFLLSPFRGVRLSSRRLSTPRPPVCSSKKPSSSALSALLGWRRAKDSKVRHCYVFLRWATPPVWAPNRAFFRAGVLGSSAPLLPLGVCGGCSRWPGSCLPPPSPPSSSPPFHCSLAGGLSRFSPPVFGGVFFFSFPLLSSQAVLFHFFSITQFKIFLPSNISLSVPTISSLPLLSSSPPRANTCRRVAPGATAGPAAPTGLLGWSPHLCGAPTAQQSTFKSTKHAPTNHGATTCSPNLTTHLN